MTQAQAAHAMAQEGFSWRQTTVAKTEAGDRPLYMAELGALCKVYDVDIVDLLRAVEEGRGAEFSAIAARERAVAKATMEVERCRTMLAHAEAQLRQAEEDLRRARAEAEEGESGEHQEED